MPTDPVMQAILLFRLEHIRRLTSSAQPFYNDTFLGEALRL